MKKYFITTLICLVLTASVAYGAIIHVPGDQPTIQAGIDAAVDGDTVLVADGTYTGDGNRDIDFKGKAITVKSENSAENCIIDCQSIWVDPHRGFYFHSGEIETSVVDGFTIKNGWVDDDGGGIYCYYSSPTITNTTITENSALSGGGIYCFYHSFPTLINCILWDDNPQEIYFYSYYPNGIEVSYSDVQGGKEGIVHSHPGDVIIWGEGNIDADPLFVDPDNGNYRLSDYSPCIGAGIMTPDVPDKDIEGNPRPNPPGSNPDIGLMKIRWVNRFP